MEFLIFLIIELIVLVVGIWKIFQIELPKSRLVFFATAAVITFVVTRLTEGIISGVVIGVLILLGLFEQKK